MGCTSFIAVFIGLYLRTNCLIYVTNISADFAIHMQYYCRIQSHIHLLQVEYISYLKNIKTALTNRYVTNSLYYSRGSWTIKKNYARTVWVNIELFRFNMTAQYTVFSRGQHPRREQFQNMTSSYNDCCIGIISCHVTYYLSPVT